jgi:Tol biopolymer transport system component/predicted Ser/Thr protein kinase
VPYLRRAVDDVAAAILDGTPVNWETAESTSPAPDRDLIPFLRVVARIADAHRTETTTARAGPSGEAGPLEAWGHLRVLERLGSGAFGEVYRAWDSRLDREVALKVLDAGAPTTEGSPVVAEGRLLARVRHPNVVTVYGAERVDGRVGLWMEFIRGRPLDELVRAQGAFSGHEAAVTGLAVCRALSAVHRAGLLHRDIKAQNVMREDGGRVVLMDFGTGTLASESANEASARLAGTPLYLAPELFSNAEPTAQSDIYSVGVLLFHLVSRSFPVTGRSLEELRAAHEQGRKRFLRDERADLPDEFIAVVERALARDPAGRYPTAGAMEDALARVVAGRTAPAVRAAPRWVWASLAAAAVVVAAAMAAPRAWQDRGRDSSGPAPPGSAAAATIPVVSSVTVRKIAMPPAMFFGRPSPDGRLFSFSDEEGNLAVFELETGEIHRLTSVEKESEQHAMFSAISADGRSVAYTWWALDGRHELRVIGTDGRRARVLLRSDAVDVPRPIEWSRDGTSILSALTRNDGMTDLALVSTEDGGIQVIRELPADVRHASLSPDGRRVVYDAPQQPADGARDIFIGPADGPDHRALVTHPASDTAPVWTPDGRRVLFASDRSGASDLWSVTVNGDGSKGEPELVHRGLGRMWILGLTDGGTYYYLSVVGTVEVYDSAISSDGRLGRPVPLGSSYAGSNISSTWSPDGREVAYASRRGLVGFDRRSTTLVIRDVETGAQRELVPALNGFLVRSWSPDGRRILVGGSDFSGRSGAYAIEVETGRAAAVLQARRPSDAGNFGRPEWTPDGLRLIHADRAKRVLLFRDLANGTPSVALDFRTEGIEGIVGDVLGRGYKLSPDGRTLAFSAKVREGRGWADVLRIRTDGQASRELLRIRHPGNLVFQDWMPDGRTLLFTTRKDRQSSDGIELWRIDLDGNQESLGLSMKALRDVSVHPDGRRVTFTAGAPVLEVWAIENAIADGRPLGTAVGNAQ